MNSKNISLVSGLIFVALIALAFLYAANLKGENINYVFINHYKIKVELADTPQKRGQGLSGRQSLCENCGMLFVFQEPTIPNFWMRDMNFPLDIIWIKDSAVIGFEENLLPLKDGSSPVYYHPNESITAALELNASWIKNHQIKVGDIVKF
ncbi:hypothetical protein A2V95_03020 [Candidatus Kuenenbacteria bacterium RBG_16_41_7]|uniref:DUF192 domain-containing protein n=1 Tax=Candidatus Kuenenbacteria bacterium RBG_16_41_7 TaxID=1798560 RepID=A0A1F6GCR0_9BACT|nr:MAG: hypothetical protein A2V95_03020 [Candidatus Kuenenbacteria bacterium RBG_16_41_7]